ncbi:hypothetical protein [Lentilactobacillus buchneri]|nr:hypothetical protein [Lentilactobacillus buchneri]
MKQLDFRMVEAQMNQLNTDTLGYIATVKLIQDALARYLETHNMDSKHYDKTSWELIITTNDILGNMLQLMIEDEGVQNQLSLSIEEVQKVG